MTFFQLQTVDHELSTKRWSTWSITSLEPYETGSKILLADGTVLKIIENVEFVLNEINNSKTLLIFNQFDDGIIPEFDFI